MAERDVYIAIGSNVEPLRHVPAALSALEAVCGPLACSPAYRSAPVGFEGPDFVNCVVRGRSAASPQALTAHFKSLEQLAGRRRQAPNSSRELDLDLVLYGDAVIRRGGVRVPRADILRYAFVLRPLSELSPDAVHPETGRSFAWHWEHFEGERIALRPVALPEEAGSGVRWNVPAAPAYKRKRIYGNSEVDTPDSFDVGAADFQSRVIEASRQKPVLVDFWAAWCGPCRMLGPVLETVVARHGGAVSLAKVDTDREQELAARYGVRGLPTVKLFRDGRAVEEFVGARPESAVEAFLKPHLPDPAGDAVGEAAELERRGRRDAAVERLETAHAEYPQNAAVAAALAGHYLARGRADRAGALYEALPGPAQAEPAGRALAGRLRFADVLRQAPAPGTLADRAEAGDPEALHALAAYDVMAGHLDEAAAKLLRAFAAGRDWRGGLLRRALLDLMEIAGHDDPRVAEWRRKLGQLLH